MKQVMLVLICLGILTGAVLIVLHRLADHDLAARQSEDFSFLLSEYSLRGTLWLPDTPIEAAMVIVHGDGPQDRLSSGGYAPFINAMLDAGVAVASWDKPGVGVSSGNWLDQSMTDRAVETRAALELLQQRFADLPVGALGFSQAGWVLPKLGSGDADFLVLVGPAISWQQQGAYYTRVRLERSDPSIGPTEIEAILADQRRRDAILFRPGATFAELDVPGGMSEDRWSFVQRNHLVDASADLQRLSLPLFALWGADDLNVDAQLDAALYQAALATSDVETRLQIVPHATHGLLKADRYNYQLTSQWPWHAEMRFLWEGRNAYVPGTLEMIADWIKLH